MKKKVIAVFFCGIVLVACQSAATPSESSSTEAVTQATQTTTKSKATVQKGENYYYVQGKYDIIPIVNKKYPVPKDYNPGENAVAKAAFLNLQKEMQAQGFKVAKGYSGFRDYALQTYFYNSYVAQDGKAKADTYSARPGYSEHQTGLAFDLWEDEAGTLLEEPQAAKWLAENAHRFGFIVRYVPAKQHITGYQAEAWHVRYIGQEAEEVYKSGLALEEYFGIEGGDYAE